MNQQAYEMTKTLMGIKFMAWAALRRLEVLESLDTGHATITYFVASRLLDNDYESLDLLSPVLAPVKSG